MGSVGVLGGGLQGCCVALALAARGVPVTLVDENADLLTRTAVANEGKVHLGYMYAADPSLATARTMMAGALAFAPFLRRHLGEDVVLATSSSAAYVVHRDSQRPPEDVAAYLTAVHDLVAAAARGQESAYFGQDLAAPVRRWAPAEIAERFDPEHATAVFDSPEVAIDPVRWPSRCGPGSPPSRSSRCAPVIASSGSSATVATATRCSGTGRRGLVGDVRPGRQRPVGRPPRGRRDLGIATRSALAAPAQVRRQRPLARVADASPERDRDLRAVRRGGQVYPDRTTYLTWYPACVIGYSDEVSPPSAWQTYPGDPVRSGIVTGTVDGLARIVPALAALRPGHLVDAIVKGGVIVAWGETDIDDPRSELHNRYDDRDHIQALLPFGRSGQADDRAVVRRSVRNASRRRRH